APNGGSEPPGRHVSLPAQPTATREPVSKKMLDAASPFQRWLPQPRWPGAEFMRRIGSPKAVDARYDVCLLPCRARKSGSSDFDVTL
ncbi:MAG: hypothetical protein ACRD2B_00345, partial [Terriglobia bacterium]